MPDTETAYNLALDYIYSFVDYSLKHSSELARADFNLDRMRALMRELSDPQRRYPILHVAGTKGKGSVCALAASALQAAGYKTGLYTSPHLLDFAERIQINGAPLAHETFVELVEELKPAVRRIEKLTTFEITTALGFLAFARAGCTAAVIEVGLGGRLDATNVVEPCVSVITSLSYDHMAVLGDTLAKIAGEKAGIIKPGVPVISAPQKDEALEVLLRISKERNSPLLLIGRDIQVEPIEGSLDGQSLKVISGGKTRRFRIPLLGAHQVTNAATAWAALQASGLVIPDAALRRGFAEVKWRARFEVARREPPLIFDSAHNDDSFARLRETLDTYFPGRPVYLIFGASEDKNVPGMLREIKPRVKRLLISRADHPRALTPERIAEL
ncbi:MAG TPA: folylpolyglutamate synthase/dihydrofolate synthase family protein, partial [Anaerolineales bacterium]